MKRSRVEIVRQEILNFFGGINYALGCKDHDGAIEMFDSLQFLIFRLLVSKEFDTVKDILFDVYDMKRTSWNLDDCDEDLSAQD
jgi:hypothetical protein